jgi:hypothetical protein
VVRGALAAPARSAWRTVLDVIGVLDVIAAAVIVMFRGTALGCQALAPTAGSRQVAVAFSPGGRTVAFADGGDHAYLCPVPCARPIRAGSVRLGHCCWQRQVLVRCRRRRLARHGGYAETAVPA